MVGRTLTFDRAAIPVAKHAEQGYNRTIGVFTMRLMQVTADRLSDVAQLVMQSLIQFKNVTAERGPRYISLLFATQKDR